MDPLSAPPSGVGNVIQLADFLEGVKPTEKETLAQLVGSLLPGDDELEIRLEPHERLILGTELKDVIDACDTAMPQRLRRWREVKDAYNLVPDPLRQGQKSDASRLVSEMTRSQVNTASARLEESILGVRPFIKFDVWFESEPDPDTAALVEEARAAEEFFEGYAATDLEVNRWLPAGVHRACKLGTAIFYVRWLKETQERTFRNAAGNFETSSEEIGRIHVALVANENIVAWPLHETEIDRMAVFGHRTFYTPAEFRVFAGSIGLAKEEVERIVAVTTGDSDRSDHLAEDLAGKDIRTSGLDPFKGQVEITELWCDLALPGDDRPTKFQCFLHEKSGPDKSVLWVGRWAYNCGMRPYFDLQYWAEDGSFWGSGVGHELVYAQAAGSSLMNLLIDNLKIIANHLRIVRAGSTAEALQDQIGPGYNLVTENPEEDVRITALGGDLSHIYQAMDRNEQNAVRLTGVTAPLQGMGDPTLKSGASPSSLQMLINEANQKFGKVDKNFRKTFGRMFAFFLDMVQQFAPAGLFYARASEQQADVLRRMRYKAPSGDLARRFRIRVEAPSATSNREVLKQNIMVIYQLTQGHLKSALELGAQVIGKADPAGFEQFQRQLLELNQELYRQIVQIHEVPGVGGKVPRVPTPTPEHEQINQLTQQLEQLQGKLQQMQQQMQQQQAPPGGPPGGPPGMMSGGPPGGMPGMPMMGGGGGGPQGQPMPTPGG